MVDRYDEAVRQLRDQPVPELWEEVEARTAQAATGAAPAGDAEVVDGPAGDRSVDDQDVLSLDDERGRRRPPWPALVAAAAAGALLVWGGVALLDDSDPTVVTTNPVGPSTSRPPSTTTEPSTTTLPPAAAPTTEPQPEPDPAFEGDEGDDGRPEAGSGPGSEELAGCSDVELSSTGGPVDLAPVVEPATPDDPRLPEMLHPGLAGVFESSSTSERAVFVVDRWGFGEDGGRYLTHGSLGEVWLAYGGGQGIVELSATVDDESCEITLWSIGLTEDELEQFVLSLSIAH